MQEVIEKQNERLKTAEKIICEYKSVYRDYNKEGESYIKFEPIYSAVAPEDIGIKIEGGYNLDHSYWAVPEFNRIILRNFMILKSLFPKEKIALIVPEAYRDKIHFTEDALRILINYECKLYFSERICNGLPQKLESGEDVYSVRWSLLKDNKIYFNFQTVSLICCGDDIKKVSFEARLENMTDIKNEELFYNTEMVKDFCEGKLSRRRLVSSLFSLLCANEEVKKRCPHIISLEIKIASCIAILENICEEDIKSILNEMVIKLGLLDESLVNKIVMQIINYQNSLLNCSGPDETAQNLVYQARKKMEDIKRIKK